MTDLNHSSLIKVANHKIDRSKRGVKSEMVQKFVGKEFKIDDKKVAPPKLRRTPTGETYEEQLKRVKEQNEEIKAALDRANAEKKKITETYNALLDDYKEIQIDYSSKVEMAEKQQGQSERLEKIVADMDREMTDMKKVKQSVDTSVVVLDDYLVKLGKVFVDGDHNLGQDYLDVGHLDYKKAKELSDFTGGKVYQMAIVPYGGEAE